MRCTPCSPNCLICLKYDECTDCGNGSHIKSDNYCGECDENEYLND